MAASQTLISSTSFDDFLNMDLLDQTTLTPTTNTNTLLSTPIPYFPQLPIQIEGEVQLENNNGMSFSELFRQYTEADSGKRTQPLPLPLAPLITNQLDDHPFSLNSGNTLFEPSDSFSPSVFMPSIIPGSPVGGFSPSSDNSGSNGRRLGSLSPLSIGDLELDLSLDASDENGIDAEMDNNNDNISVNWGMDPSFFGNLGSSGLGNLVLPPLPDLPTTFNNNSNGLAQDGLELDIKSEEQSIDFNISPPPPIATSSTKTSRRSISTVEENEEDEEEEEDEDEEMGEGDSDDSEASAKPTTSSNKSKSKSKLTALGVKRVQKLAKTSVAGFATSTLHATSSRSTLPPVPEWTDKPDPESYKKLNSKEKRQLRNKISARNFRHRRKEYITTLEEEISSRDTIITQLRDEVGIMRSENKSLKSEVSLLKQKWDEMLEKMTSFTVPTASTSSSTSTLGLGTSSKLASGTSPSSEEWPLDTPVKVNRTRGSNGIAKPSVNKDIAPGSMRAGGWATAGSYMPVHTTLLPDFSLGLNPKPVSFYGRQSFNPSINALNASQLAQLPNLTSHLRTNNNSTNSTSSTADNFFDTNPFWLRQNNIEEYRGQLYGKVAHNLAGAQAQAKESSSASSTTSSSSTTSVPPIPAGFRPSFFTTPTNTNTTSPSSPRSNLISLLSGKESRDTYTSPSELLSYQSPRAASQQQADQSRQAAEVLVGALAAKTLLDRLTGAFISAFIGEGGDFNGSMCPSKVSSVLEGRSKVMIVEVEQKEDVSNLGLQMNGLALSSNTSTTTSTRSTETIAANGFSGGVCSKWLSCKKEE